MTMRWHALTFCLVGLAHALQAQRVQVGLVDSVVGPGVGLRITRESTPERLLVLHPLYAGDSVSASDDSTRVRVVLHGRAPLWLCGTKVRVSGCLTGLRIGTTARAGGTRRALADLLNNTVGRLFIAERSDRQALAVSRGAPPIEIPLLRGKQELVAGQRDLEIAWSGGTAPYRVRILRRDGSEVRSEPSLAGELTSFRQVDLLPGAYSLEISDSDGQIHNASFSAVAAENAPAMPPLDGYQELSGSAQVVVRAMWLADQDDGQWLWEAYLRLGATRVTDLTERARMALASGTYPPGR